MHESSDIDRLVGLYLQTREEKYFSMLCEVIYPHLIDYAAKTLRGNLRMYAYDIVSDTILKMRDKTLSNYRVIDGISYKFWCYRLLREQIHVYIIDDNIRKLSKVPETPYEFEILTQEKSVDSTPYGFSKDNRIIGYGEIGAKTYIENIIESEISNMPDIYKVVLRCVYIDDKSYKEACDILGVTIHVLKTRLYIGKKMLRTKLANKHPEIKELLDDFSRN